MCMICTISLSIEDCSNSLSDAVVLVRLLQYHPKLLHFQLSWTHIHVRNSALSPMYLAIWTNQFTPTSFNTGTLILTGLISTVLISLSSPTCSLIFFFEYHSWNFCRKNSLAGLFAVVAEGLWCLAGNRQTWIQLLSNRPFTLAVIWPLKLSIIIRAAASLLSSFSQIVPTYGTMLSSYWTIVSLMDHVLMNGWCAILMENQTLDGSDRFSLYKLAR